MKTARILRVSLAGLVATICAAALFTAPAHAEGIALPPEAVQAMDKIYGGNPEAAIAIAHDIEQAQPDHPLGYLLEAEANWWKMYCAACEIKYGMVDAWKRGKKPEDDAYLTLASKVVKLAQAELAKSDTAEMHIYAGIGWGLKARLYGLRAEHRNVARAAVSARTEFLRALQLDPQAADATAGVGLYNFYVDTLSPIVKILRFFMGIPGGDKDEGIRQIQMGADRGVLMAVDARYYLAKDLRTYDLKYQQALSVAEPLATRYPHNPMFLLLAGNLNAELGRKDKASEYFHAALATPVPDDACAARTRDLANSFLATVK